VTALAFLALLLSACSEPPGPPVSDSRDRGGNGGAFYQYCRQHGTWLKAVSGWGPQVIDAAYEAALAFIERHMERGK
jgi:putative hemolysin